MELTKNNFEKEILSHDGLCIVDFWASWCMPCKMLSPVIDELAEEYPEVKIGKVNVDEQGELAAKYGIASIPTLLFFRGGEIVKKNVGYRAQEELPEINPESREMQYGKSTPQ